MTIGDSANRIRLDASPSKRSVLNRAQAYAPDIAVYELIDNAIDRWRETGQPRPLEVDIDLSFDGSKVTEITIRDNAGGVPRSRLEALVKPGVENPTPEAIGVWGEGLKVASLALGKEATFRTRYGDGPTYRVHWDEDWWQHDDWTIYAEVEEDELPAESFEVTLSNLNQPLRRSEIFPSGPEGSDPLVERVGRTYAPLLSPAQRPPVEIRIRDSEGTSQQVSGSTFGDPDRVGEIFAFPPGYEPTRHLTSFPVPEDLQGPEAEGQSRLRVEAIVGLLPEQSRDLSGVSMYGKGRLFALALREGAVGFGTRGPAKIPASHPTTWRLLVLLYFDGPSAAIPWRAPTKDGYRENHPNHDELRSFIQEITLPYATFSKVAKRLDILPFSQDWNELDEEKRRDEVRSYCQQASLVGEFFSEAAHLSEDASSKPLRTINHDQPHDDEGIPALSQEQSRLVARFLKQRDRREPTTLWGGPESPVGGEQAIEQGEAALSSETRMRASGHVLSEASRRDLEEQKAWEESDRISVSLPQATLDLIREQAPEGTIAEWIRQVVDDQAGGLDGVWHIPQQEYRPIVKRVRQETLDTVDGVVAIGLFGSVARGTADRESDIDLLVLHEDSLEVQRRLNELFSEFRFPAGKAGDRYTVRPEVLTPEAFQERAESDSETYRELASQAIWLYPRPGFRPPTEERLRDDTE